MLCLRPCQKGMLISLRVLKRNLRAYSVSAKHCETNTNVRFTRLTLQ